MQYTTLGLSNLTVSRISLGTVFRSEPPDDVCLAAIDEAAERGCNFIDCANCYRDGLSERLVGRFLRGRRDRFVVTTKVGAAMASSDQPAGLSRAAIHRAVDASLRRLGTDYIDCYLCHMPDPDTPIEETLGAMDELVRAGKIRYPGCSRFESWRLRESLTVAERDGVSPFICNQVGYSLLDRRIEDELVPLCRQRNVAITAFACTAIGLLSGRFRHGQAPPPETSWARGPYNFRAAMTPGVDRVVQALIDVAERHDRTPTQVAMAWCLRQDPVASVIIGADTPERVRENLDAADWILPDDDWEHLNRLSQGQRLVVRKDCPRGYCEEVEASR
jgi:aryl-alcohol dehydrogenase-like predicted oxidoreductase